jgi:hypothetical protein
MGGFPPPAFHLLPELFLHRLHVGDDLVQTTLDLAKAVSHQVVAG